MMSRWAVYLAHCGCSVNLGYYDVISFKGIFGSTSNSKYLIYPRATSEVTTGQIQQVTDSYP